MPDEPEPEMNANPESADKPAFEWPSTEEFGAWLKADPKNQEWWLGVIERSLKGEYGEITPEMRAAAQTAVTSRQTARSLELVVDKFREFRETAQSPPGAMTAEERLARCNAIMDELTDALLETPEPHRSNFLKQLLPLRERVRALKVQE